MFTEIQSNTMAKVAYSIRLDEEMKKKLDAEAKAQNRTVANLIDTILSSYFDKAKKKKQ